MNALIGKDAQYDEIFWNHSTWDENGGGAGGDGDDGEEGSFNIEDENESDAVGFFIPISMTVKMK